MDCRHSPSVPQGFTFCQNQPNRIARRLVIFRAIFRHLPPFSHVKWPGMALFALFQLGYLLMHLNLGGHGTRQWARVVLVIGRSQPARVGAACSGNHV